MTFKNRSLTKSSKLIHIVTLRHNSTALHCVTSETNLVRCRQMKCVSKFQLLLLLTKLALMQKLHALSKFLLLLSLLHKVS